MASAAIPQKMGASAGQRKFAFAALLLFSFIYYARPEDFIPGLDIIPLGKVSGGIALIALVVGLGKRTGLKMPTEVKILLLMFAHMILTIPFSIWRGGSFSTVFDKFSKGVIVALLIGMIVTAMFEFRRLLWTQAAAVAILTVFSVIVHRTVNGRLSGLQKGILENPNDLAINIAINFPLCIAFMLGARGIFRKAIWGIAVVFMIYGVVITYSRSGMIALVLSGIICLWQFGIKGKRIELLLAAGILLVGMTVVAVSTRHFVERMHSLVAFDNLENSGDQGSLEARQDLLKKSIGYALEHPLFGVGPGMFPVVTNQWVVAHNTYTELAAEAGFPALGLFLLALGSSLRSLRAIRKSPGYKQDKELQLWTGGLTAGLLGYMVGAMFASTEYNLFPYFMIAYSCALYRIAWSTKANGNQPANGTTLANATTNRKAELAWTR